MNRKWYPIVSMLILLSLLISASAFAQGSGPDNPAPERGTRPQPAALSARSPTSYDKLLPSMDLQDEDRIVDAPDMPVGASGLTASWVQSYGARDRAYYDDTSHLSYPYGVGADGAFVWIADSGGNRALKYNGSGVSQQVIGSAGFREYYPDLSLAWITDVATDSGGNIWLVDGNAHHVAKFNSSGEYQVSLGTMWSPGSDNNHFSRPMGVAFDAAGNIYVSDRNNNRIQIFDSTGNWIYTLGSLGNGNYNFDHPEHIAIQGDNLFVADTLNQRVLIYSIGNPLTIDYAGVVGVLDDPGNENNKLNRPRGVAADNNYIYVADSNNLRVQIYSRTAPFTYFTTIGGSYGTGNNQFAWPTDVAVDSAGNIYVADGDNQRVQKFTSGFVYNRTYGATGVPYLTDQQHYNGPTGVAAAADGSLYIIEERGRRLVKINAAGVPAWKVGENGVWGNDNNHFGDPQDVEIGPDGRIYVADCGNHRVQIFNADSSFYNSFGSFGVGNGQFNCPSAIAFAPSGDIYVADGNNSRIQVFNSSRVYVTQFGGYGTGNYQFDYPSDIAFDSTGQIYVVDNGNQRVQVYNSSRVYQRSLGLTGVSGSAYDRMSNPTSVAVDTLNRVYVADGWGSRIKVYDKDGKFLNAVDNGWNSYQGLFRQVEGMDLDQNNTLYIADYLSHMIKKYIPTPYLGWQQVNVAGFGSHYNFGVWSMTVFSQTLLAATSNSSGSGAELYKMGGNNAWTQVMSGGFGDATNFGIDSFETFKNKLYAGTWNSTGGNTSNGGQVWRSPSAAPGSWENVVDDGFLDGQNAEVVSLRAYGGNLFAATWVASASGHGAEIFLSDSGDKGSWTKVFSDATPSHHFADGILAMEVYSNTLYAGMSNWETGAELWRTTDGSAWTQVNQDGFGETDNRRIIAMTAFKDHFYVGIQNYTDSGPGNSHGAQIWRCHTCAGADWEKVVVNGFGSPYSWGIGGLIEYRGQLYAVVNNMATGVEVWRTPTGDLNDWDLVGWHSFGSEVMPVSHDWGYTYAVLNDRLYISTYAREGIGGGRIWSFIPDRLFLPIVRR